MHARLRAAADAARDGGEQATLDAAVDELDASLHS
jgi:hypothetical protein